MVRLARRLLASALMGWAACAADASPQAALPSVRAVVDTNAATLGDRIGVSLELHYAADQQPQTPDVEAWLHGLAPQPARVQGPAEQPGGRLLSYRTTIQLFQLGLHRVPALDVRFVTASGDTLVRTTTPVDIQVGGVRNKGDEALRDIKPPVRVPGGIQLWILVSIAVLLVILTAALLYRWMMSRDRPVPEPAPPPPVDHAAEFVRIAGMGLLEGGEWKRYYSLLADNLRHYLELRLGVDAMELTTDEVVRRLQSKCLHVDLIGAVQAFLNTADLVKFAKMVPDSERARRAPETGVALVQRIDRWVAEQREQARVAAPAPAGVATTERAGEGAEDAVVSGASEAVMHQQEHSWPEPVGDVGGGTKGAAPAGGESSAR